MTPLPQITPKSWLMVAILGFVWGSTFMVIEIALRGFPPFWLASLRLFVGAAVMAVAWAATGFRLALDANRRPTWIALIWAGAVSSGIPFLLLNWGQQHVTSGFAGTAMAAVPIFVLPLAHFMVAGERMRPRAVLGVMLGVAGVWLLIGPDALASSGADLELWGRLACLGVAACYALNSITIRRLPPVDPIGLTTLMLVFGGLITLPFSLAYEGIPPLPGATPIAAMLFMGVVSTAAMNLLRVLVIRSAGPTFLTLVNYQVPVWSVVLGALVLNEALPPSLFAALALILFGVALSQGAALRALARSVFRPAG
ncbi:DMT family transporter [Actibacterium ureilyticum]|uniref:DMT family transporter n=1 Tax=Actibacterium ureilyticum TaxID=1590614 RepID=UPI0015958CC6|nr:DMT family transporter [Actibacterium ureilyticum]